ncbi:uncharacterized protein ALTATR162_LOCUS6013 [Alternaria atra]|uniref:Uncharacterized protein n=1 Tax=Alternaria atra TaxID=119953 RepID=A0A8J2I900_9PLEO|nr:uncharacterized protein ALTATR162_LOCUS6013 [Alternaria atra]CAG5161353.1 unnamed protein product [Alternaria atra]
MTQDQRAESTKPLSKSYTPESASTLPSAPTAPDTILPYSPNSSRIELALQASTVADVANVGGTYAAVLGSGSQTTMAVRIVSDERRFGIYLPSATASENNLVPHRLGASTPHVLQERAASLPPYSLAAAAALEQRTRRPRRFPYQSEHQIHDDPPPEYVALDPYPFFDTELKPRRRSIIEIIETLCKDGPKATTGKVAKNVVKIVEDVGKIAKDVPTAFKEAQVKLSTRRAKDKIRWLEKRNYLSGQERLLTQELVG